MLPAFSLSVFFFNDTAPTEIYTLSLHDALPIYDAQVVGRRLRQRRARPRSRRRAGPPERAQPPRDRKSTRLNSSHMSISYAVFCLKKKIHTSPSDDQIVENR